jgi:succinoglycan biosynthesis transport protein ExoP
MGDPASMKTLTPQDYIEIAHRYRWWLIIPMVAGLSVAAVLAFVLPKSYRSSTLIFVDPQKVPEEYVRASVTGSIEDRLSTIRQQLLSRTLLQRTIDEFHLYPDKIGKTTNEEVIEWMRQQITIETVRGRSIDAFTISFVGSDPATTMNVTNKLASLFIGENLKIREQLVEGTTDFLNVELRQLKEKLEAQEQSISGYKQRYMGSLPGQLDANLRTLDRLQLKLQSLNTSLREAESRKLLLNQMQAGAGDIPLPTTTAPVIRDPRIEQLRTLQRRLGELQAEYTENYPDIATTKEKITQLEAELQIGNSTASENNPRENTAPRRPSARPADNISPIDQEILQLQAEKQSMIQEITEYEKRVEETPKREQELTSLSRDYENTKRSYDILSSKSDNAKISENLEKRQQGEQFRILDPANFPEKPFKPNLPILLVMGLCIGAGIGASLAFIRENLDTSIKKVDELEEQFGLPVLGVIPQADALRKVGSLTGSTLSPRQPAPTGGQS